MMADERRKELLTQYEDIALALLMDEYALDDGKALLREFAEAEQPRIPPELDNTCAATIRSTFAKQTRSARIKQVFKSVVRAAIVMIMTLGLSVPLVLSVEALRVPLLNFLLQQKETYTLITANPPNSQLPYNSLDQLMLVSPIPDNYEFISQEIMEDGTGFVCYADENGNVLSLSAMDADGKLHIDTEDAIVTEAEMYGFHTLCAEKEGFNLVWVDPKTNLMYILSGYSMDEDSFWAIAHTIMSWLIVDY